MRLLFVRHGEPNYRDDCLTPTGLKQAEACAKRLEHEGITKIYSSPMGRALETARFTSELLDLPIKQLDYMHEISWGSRDGSPLPMDGHPWALASRLIEEGDWNFKDDNWRNHPYFRNNLVMDYHDLIVDSIDEFLEKYGYERYGTRYFCHFLTDETPVIFSHGGSSGCAISHIINLPFPYFASIFEYWFTSIIVLEFPDKPGSIVYPRVRLFNDCAHANKKDTDEVIYKL
ncbi:MAG: histidine phosphatase family protein [Lachnospiraceae bacterium]|nr:histidine phosphatase family protein [Lachnospiraceae bacterium]